MAANKFLNWTKPAITTNAYWPGVIQDDKYIEDINFGTNDAFKYPNMSTGTNSIVVNNCTGDYNFIRIFKIQPTTHKLVVQLHITTQLSATRTFKIGVFGTIDDVSDDALWCRVPDQGIGAAINQNPTNSNSGTATNISYSPFAVLTTNTSASIAKGEFDEVGAPTTSDTTSNSKELTFLHSGTGGSTNLVGANAQYVMNVDQLGYDYIAIKISSTTPSSLTSGACRFIVRQFN